MLKKYNFLLRVCVCQRNIFTGMVFNVCYLCLLCYVSQHLLFSFTSMLTTLPASVSVPAVSSTLKMNCLQQGTDRVRLNIMYLCPPWWFSSARSSCGPESHGALHTGNPLSLTNSCTNKLPLTTEKHKRSHASFLSAFELNMTYY